MIGVFDSGLGGLTVLRQLREMLPQHDLLYFADQANVPYGDKTPGELHELSERNVAFFNASGVEAIVMACNTSCATAAELGWPASAVPVLDLIESAALAVAEGQYARVGVVATAATARSGAYANAIAAVHANARVVELAAPALVPLVEAGELHGSRPLEAVASVCAALPADIDALVLGCTHYPLLEEHFRAVLSPAVAIVDPARRHAQRAKELVERLGIRAEGGSVFCVTSGRLPRFREQVNTLAGGLQPQISAIMGSDHVWRRPEYAGESTGG